MKQLLQVQNQITTQGLTQNQFLSPKLVVFCSESNRMDYAQRVFAQMESPNVVLWNTMFKGLTENGFYRETLNLYWQMKNRDVEPNNFTFPFVLRACAKLSAIKEGRELHCVILKSGFTPNIFVGTTLSDMYSGCREMEFARQVFDEMPERNVVSWTSIIAGYILCGELGCARQLFDQIPENDVISWNTMIAGYADSGDMHSARQLFDEMMIRDLISWNTVLLGYVNNRELEFAKKFFEEMPERNVFSWNGLIGGYARNHQFFDVLALFNRMLVGSIVKPNDATLVIVLSAIARLGALDLGKWVQVYAEINGFRQSLFVCNGLIDMYAKCGAIERATQVFDLMPVRDLITWNSMIGGLAMHGRGIEALQLFEFMKNKGEKPDGITFVGILCACTHLGLIEDGFKYFKSMIEDFSIQPKIEHYGCMVDLLGRAGLLSEAVDFVNEMPIEADCIIWSALLGACRIYSNIELAELAIKKLIGLEPKNAANYVILSNIYGAAGRWEEAARLKLVMKEMKIQKLPGCSLIEVNNGVEEFYSSDKRHSQSEEIYLVLKRLTEQLRLVGYEPKVDEPLLHGIEEENH